jgi:hypothetical protein
MVVIALLCPWLASLAAGAEGNGSWATLRVKATVLEDAVEAWMTVDLTTLATARATVRLRKSAPRENNIPVNVHWLESAHEFSAVERAIGIVLADAAKALRASEAQP